MDTKFDEIVSSLQFIFGSEKMMFTKPLLNKDVDDAGNCQ